jgi:hypothetical protein
MLSFGQRDADSAVGAGEGLRRMSRAEWSAVQDARERQGALKAAPRRADGSLGRRRRPPGPGNIHTTSRRSGPAWVSGAPRGKRARPCRTRESGEEFSKLLGDGLTGHSAVGAARQVHRTSALRGGSPGLRRWPLHLHPAPRRRSVLSAEMPEQPAFRVPSCLPQRIGIPAALAPSANLPRLSGHIVEHSNAPDGLAWDESPSAARRGYLSRVLRTEAGSRASVVARR